MGNGERIGGKAELAVIGLGPMGAPIAQNLLEAGVPLAVWNRTASKVEGWARRGARVAAMPAQAACSVVLTVLPDLPEVEAVLFGPEGLIAGWQSTGVTEPVLVIHGTVSPIGVKSMAEQLREQCGIRVIDAPLSGGTIGAREGTLSMMVGGDKSCFDHLVEVFGHYATTIRYLGASGAGALAKACNQVIVASTVAAVSEAILLARSSDLDIEALFDVFKGGLANSEVITQKSTKWIHEDYAEGGSAKNQLKDLVIIEETAQALKLTLHETAAVTRLFSAMVESGDGELDHTGVYRTIAQQSGEGDALSIATR